MSTRPPMAARDVALEALVRIDDGAFAHIVLPGLLRGSSLTPRDRAFVTDLVYGTVRARRRLDARLAAVSSRPLSRVDPIVLAGLRLGARQLETGVAQHAAVAETVDAIARRSPRARGFANACLRALTRTSPDLPPSGDPITDLGVELSYPDWIVRNFVTEFGAPRARAILATGNEPAAVTLRPARHRSRAAELDAEFAATPGMSVEPGTVVPDARIVRGIGDPAALAAVRQGRATPQDQSSMAVVTLVDPQPGDRVLDLAAAPGGKSTGIAELVGPHGFVVASDLQPGRLALVERASKRLELTDRLATLVADGAALPAPDASFDRVLVDAPCSGLGVLRRRPDARWRTREGAIAGLAAIQRALVAEAVRVVRPGGTIVYSVCTLTAPETIDLDRWLEKEHPELVAPGPLPEPWEPHGRGARLLPDVTGTDGMYALILRAPGSAPGPAGTAPRMPE